MVAERIAEGNGQGGTERLVRKRGGEEYPRRLGLDGWVDALPSSLNVTRQPPM